MQLSANSEQLLAARSYRSVFCADWFYLCVDAAHDRDAGHAHDRRVGASDAGFVHAILEAAQYRDAVRLETNAGRHADREAAHEHECVNLRHSRGQLCLTKV